jgi:hypothetical protein
MTIRTGFCVLASLALLGAAAPAFAQEVPADANKALWCATAFTLVEPEARKQGQTEAADHFKSYSTTLSQTSHDSLTKAGFSEDQIKSQTTAYTDKVTKELTGSGQPEFSEVECVTLVDPAAAQAIQQQQQAPAPDATPAPDNATPPANGDASGADATPAPSGNGDSGGATTPAN